MAQANKAKAATSNKFVSDNHYFLAFVELVWWYNYMKDFEQTNIAPVFKLACSVQDNFKQLGAELEIDECVYPSRLTLPIN